MGKVPNMGNLSAKALATLPQEEFQLPTMLNAYTSMYTRKECASCISMDELRMSPEEAARLEMEYLKETKGEDYERYMQEMAAFLELPLTSVPDGLF